MYCTRIVSPQQIIIYRHKVLYWQLICFQKLVILKKHIQYIYKYHLILNYIYRGRGGTNVNTIYSENTFFFLNVSYFKGATIHTPLSHKTLRHINVTSRGVVRGMSHQGGMECKEWGMYRFGLF